MPQREHFIAYWRHVRRLLERGECHPSWGSKRLARIAKRIDQKEREIAKRITGKHRPPRGGGYPFVDDLGRDYRHDRNCDTLS